MHQIKTLISDLKAFLKTFLPKENIVGQVFSRRFQKA
jgi:hypothetical protein